MQDLIIHAGMPRTGSKSIQHSLMTLDGEKMLYAPVSGAAGFPNHSQFLRNLFTPPEDPLHEELVKRFGAHEFAAIVDSAKSKLKEAVRRAGGRSLVLSAEGLTRLSGRTLRRMKHGLARHAAQPKIIAYIRPPLSFIESALQQRIRQGHSATGTLATLWPRYQASFQKLDTVFGAENVTLLKFDPQRYPQNDVVVDFCQRLGIPASGIQITRRNEALTRTAALLLHQHGLAAQSGLTKPLTTAQANAVAERLRALDSTPFRLSPAILEPLREGWEGDVAWMEERLGESLSETAAPAGESSTFIADLETPVPDAAERIAALIAEDGGVPPDADRGDVHALLMTLADLTLRKNRKVEPPRAESPAPRPAKSAAAPVLPYRDMARPDLGRPAPSPLTSAPPPLINKDKNLLVLWSPKSACTTVYVWFAHVSGFAADVRAYARWPHRHRIHQYLRSELYHDSASSGMPDASPLKIIRDPYGRAVSIYRHALQTDFADLEMEAWSGGKISADTGYSFQTFLDLLETLDMSKVDIHFRPQFHPLERERPLRHVINISKSDLFAGLNAFEEEQGLPKTDFADLDWLHQLERGRKAKQEPLEGEFLDEAVFTRRDVQKLARFPNYAQLLTPRARDRIEKIYAADFEAYASHL